LSKKSESIDERPDALTMSVELHAETLKRHEEFLRQHEAMLQRHEEVLRRIDGQLDRAAAILMQLKEGE
jgi:hypothetical protein